jgi:superfamily I DNA/RNA helicase
LANIINYWINKEQLPRAEIAVLVSKQLDLYADHLMMELQLRGVPYRNEQQMQDITVEPAARLSVDYLSCLYGKREPKAWIRLMNQLIPFADEEIQSSKRKELDRLLKKQRIEAAIYELVQSPFSGWWTFVKSF